ncbi:recombinase family protein [Elizabethkingia ursingii]|uniref:recombinase family protein n=1 Tax=Elizabethkingia ursingii TaxID=1756150 RepID=UPI00075185AC|nr:recombinase family protein [Elizabethkingia ursingii]KUY26097.1 hypothetical protein ATB96_07065 [Elizabethkingia ursingii]
MLGIPQHKNKKAIAYYRHSAEDKQENSVSIQREHTENFALENNIEIIHEEIDEGKSGLIANRPGFERLFANWIENNKAPLFDYVLVYDVSRWGRFQDGDQAAYFVHLCKKHGKEVIYVSRGFPDQANQLFSSLETSIQRYMAAEYSRQLSDKVFYGCIKVSQQGYSAGGSAVYGMTRVLLDINKERIRPLELGEHKQIANERVSFAPKNDETTLTVKTIYDLFVNKRYSISYIINCLNEKEILSANDKLWDKSKIIKVLTQEAYIGTRIYNKTKGRLKQKTHSNPRSEWIVVPKAFEATIDELIFIKAQERLYWILPNNWRKGINAIKKAKKNLYQDIFRWLLNKGMTDFDIDEIVHKLPIVFGVKIEQESISRWCFIISEDAKKYDNILGVGVVSNSKKVTESYFLFSTRDFTKTNFLIFNNRSAMYNNVLIEDIKIESSISLLIKQLVDSKQRYKVKYQFIKELL